jgi:AraC-like DNA-binding protein
MLGDYTEYVQNHIGVLPVIVYQNGMMYCEMLPCKELRPYVANYWSILPSVHCDAPQEAISMKVLPDGCVDLILILDDEPDTCWSQLEGRTIIGLREKTLIKSFGLKANRIGVRFLPGGAFPFFNCSASSLLGVCKPLSSIWGGMVRQLEEQMTATLSLAQKIDCLEKTLLAVLRASEPPNQLVMGALDCIYQQKGMIPIDDLAFDAGTSPRNLSRMFQKWVGISPKMLCRIVRFQSALEAFLKTDGKDLSEIALVSGYYDQSHFLNEFKIFYGSTPFKARHMLANLTVNKMTGR